MSLGVGKATALGQCNEVLRITADSRPPGTGNQAAPHENENAMHENSRVSSQNIHEITLRYQMVFEFQKVVGLFRPCSPM